MEISHKDLRTATIKERNILRQKGESTKESVKDQSERTGKSNVCMTKTKDV